MNVNRRNLFQYIGGLVLGLVVMFTPASVSAQTAITWQSQTNVTVASTTISKTGGTSDFDASALSAEQLAAGAGGVFTFTTTANTGLIMWVGLSNDTAVNNFATTSHVIYFTGGTTWAIYESGSYKTEGTFVVGDSFTFDVDSSGNVVYRKNSTGIYTSATVASLPLKLDLSMSGVGASITSATYTAPGAPPAGTVWKVCAANCDFTNAQLQTAINTATAGTTLLLQEGFTYIGDYTLPVKTGAGINSWITIKTGVDANGVVQSTTRYPADNIRICPSDYTDPDDSIKNCAGKPGSTDMTRIAKIKPSGNNSYGFSLVQTGTGTPVSYYEFRWLEMVANSYGGNSLIGLNNATAPVLTGTTAMIPHHFRVNQVVFSGNALTGQFRGLEINASYVDVTNSFFRDIKAISEGQSIWANTSTGGINIVNNYADAGTEVFLTGGGGTVILPQYTVQSGATTTSIPLDRVTDLYVGKHLGFRIGNYSLSSNTAASPSVFTTAAAHGLTTGWQIVLSGVTCTGWPGGNVNGSGTGGQWPVWTVKVVSSTTFTLIGWDGNPLNCSSGGAVGSYYIRAVGEIETINGNTITLVTTGNTGALALPVAPSAGSLADSSVVIGSAAPNTFRYNWLTHPMSWKGNPIQAPATLPSATPGAGGTLAAGTYYYVVQAQRITAAGIYASSNPTTEVSATVGANGKVDLSWTAAANAERYLIYGRATGAPTMFWTVTGATTFTDTGAAGTATSGVLATTYWGVKNVYEMKTGMNWTIEKNLIENSWVQGQAGPCVLFTPSAQLGQAASSVERNIVFRYNVIRSCGQYFQLYGMDANALEAPRSGNISVTNNLWYNGGGTFGNGTAFALGGIGGGPRQTPSRAAYDLTFDHNTIHMQTGAMMARVSYLDYCAVGPNNDTQESNTPNFMWKNNIAYAGLNNAAFASTGYTTGACNLGTVNRRVDLAPNGPLGAGSSFTNNVLAGDALCGSYPANVLNTTCPAIATLESDTFTNTTTIAGFAVKPTSPHYTTSTTGGALGADIAGLGEITTITMTGDNTNASAIPPAQRRRFRRVDEMFSHLFIPLR